MPACGKCGSANPEQARFCLACGSSLAAMASDVRKTVTIVRCDLVASTALGERLDAETLRRIVNRYFEAMRHVIERHGGTVEKFVGDAVMAVFGIPTAHEDDALRALRAAIEMRSALARLNEELGPGRAPPLTMRTGVTTGEVIAGDPTAGQAFVSGDAANVAARLEQSASPGEILVGEPTYRLVSAAIEADPLPALAMKGKAEPLSAYRLLAVKEAAEAIPRRLETPLIAREQELDCLLAEFARARVERSCRVVTLIGDPGIGKSRLAEELVARVGSEATVLRGRCLPYGEGITYWPLVEMLRGVLGQETRAAIAGLLDGEADANVIAERLGAALGMPGSTGASEEIAWAARRLFEHVAKERPLVLLVDDVQWAEETFFDLLEHVAYLSRGAPILLLCLARPEVVEERSSWPGERILLEPLSEKHSQHLIQTITAALPDSAVDRVRRAAGGNPLFVEQMLAVLASDGESASIPPTIHAVLAARLDRLEPDERRALECAAVVGEEFWDGALRSLAGTAVSRPLLALVRKHVVEPYASVFPGEDAFRFVHLLVRDAAYESLPKQRRADLHARLAEWLEQKDRERGVVREEIVGYHLERAVAYRSELGLTEGVAHLAARAGQQLAAAGRRAYDRGDTPAAVSLLARAVDLLPRDAELRLDLVPDLAAALAEAGAVDRAAELLDEAIETGREPLAAHASAQRWHLRLQTDPSLVGEDALRAAQAAIGVLERFADDRGLSRAWLLLGDAWNWLGKRAEMGRAAARAAEHARRAGDRRAEADALRLFGGALVYGPTPAPDGIRELERLLADASGNPMIEAAIMAPLAALKAMRGAFEEARRLIRWCEEIFEDLGLTYQLARLGFMIGRVEILAGDAAAAEQGLQRSVHLLEAMGETGRRSSLAAGLADALLRQGKPDEAERFIALSERLVESDRGSESTYLASLRAKIAARRGSPDAEELARSALAFGGEEDDTTWRADVLENVAEVFAALGRRDDAVRVLEEALAVHEAKGNVVSARSARVLRAELAGESRTERE